MPGVSQSYSYDTIGNLTSKGGVALSYGSGGNGTGSGPHQARVVNGQAYSYDANGNLTSGGGRGITWNMENQPTSIIAGGATENYLSNADGQRIVRVAGGQTTIFVGESWEEVVGGQIRSHVLLNGAPIAVVTWSGTTAQSITYLHRDHLGSVIAVTGAGSSGPTLVSTQEYDPWGAIRSGGVSQTRRNYTGQLRDDTGLLYYTARYYDPAIGRFISADTIVPGSSPLTVWPSDSVASGAWSTSGGGPANPQELNRYSYGLNNPVRNTDPTGHWVESALDVAFIAADIAEISQDSSNGWAWASLAADVVGLALPVVTGGGMAVRAIAHADDVVDVVQGVNQASDASNLVYRGLAKGEDITNGLTARAPGLQNVDPVSHVAGLKKSPWISTTKDPRVAIEKYGEHGAVEIDLSKVDSEVVDISNGIPGVRGRLSNWAKRDREVLVRDYIPPEAIRRIR